MSKIKKYRVRGIKKIFNLKICSLKLTDYFEIGTFTIIFRLVHNISITSSRYFDDLFRHADITSDFCIKVAARSYITIGAGYK